MAGRCYTAFGLSIVGERPESGVRIAIERDKQSGPPWNYRGGAFLPDASFECAVVVSQQGEVEVTLPADAPGDLAEKVRLIVRTVFKQSNADGEPPAWKINRWRGEK
jgi:hypothetical protein